MNETGIKALKIIGITLLLGGVSFLIYKLATKDKTNKNDNPYVKGKRPSKGAGNYSSLEVKKMQEWLLRQARLNRNTIVENEIMSHGGVDGKIGQGFNASLNEAIKQGWINNIADLYDKTK